MTTSKNPAAVALGKLGGKAGTGAAKARSTSFNSTSAKAAIAARWAKTKRNQGRRVRRSNVRMSEPATSDVIREGGTECANAG